MRALTAKRLEFLKAIVPTTSLVSFLVNRSAPKQFVTEMEAAGRALGTQISPVAVEDAGDVDGAWSTMVKTARMLGLTIPKSLLVRAGELIQRAD